MSSEPTELAGAAQADTEHAHAWALDYDDPDEFPTQRLTPRRITALGVAASLILIAVAGAVALFVLRQHGQQEATTATPVTTTVPAPPTVTMTLPPPVTVTVSPSMTAAPTTSNGPTIGDECSDWMKFSTDPVSGQEMLCGGYSGNLFRGEPMKWYSAEAGAVGPSAGWADGPRVGRTGTSCDGEVPFTTGRSSDGYGVWCTGGPGSYMPGPPVWTVYQP